MTAPVPEIDAPAGAVAPVDIEGLRGLIRDRADLLPKRLRQVAALVLERPDELAFASVAEAARLAGVQPSTVVRFAQAFGFSGFSHMQALFQARLKAGFPDYGARVDALIDEDGPQSPAALLEGFARSAAASVERLRDSASQEALERCVDILAGAQTIYLLGARRVFPIVAYLAYTFGKLGLRAALIDHVGGLGPEQIALLDGRDAALAVSFTPYASTTLELAQGAARRGAAVVAITDSPFSPLAGFAAAWIEVAETDFAGFRSLSASVALALTLAVAVAERRRARAL